MSAIPAEKFTAELFDVFTETFERVNGIYLDKGTSLFETLETISAEVASRPVGANCATIAAQVAHIRYYLEVLEGHMAGRPLAKVDWGEIWRTTSAVTPEEWDASRAHLKATHQRVMALMKGFQAWDGENDIGGALAILVHTAYHLGEIRQALCTVG